MDKFIKFNKKPNNGFVFYQNLELLFIGGSSEMFHSLCI